MPTLVESIQAEASRCVRCGLCLPHCPTYTQTQHEGESPRGRIALLSGLASSELPFTPTLQTHIDQCLGCRACEIVCPAEVAYGKLLIEGREYLTQQKNYRISFLTRVTGWLLLRTSLLKIFAKTFYPAHAREKNAQAVKKGMTVTLLPGCIHPVIDNKTLKDSIFLLNYYGYPVYVPKNFICCGTWHAHHGQKAIAEKLIKKNRAYHNHKACLGTATGCTAFMHDSGLKVDDISVFLEKLFAQKKPCFKPLQKTALLHTPCTLRNGLKQADAIQNILRQIPSLTIINLKNKNCCGAAGSYFLEHPDMAKNLAKNILDEIRQHQPDMFITTNIGCAIHLKKRLAKEKIKLEILHPVSVLRQQLAENLNPAALE